MENGAVETNISKGAALLVSLAQEIGTVTGDLGAAPAAQREVWLAQRLRPNMPFNLSLYAVINGPLQADLLSKATAELVEQTPCLRSRFSQIEGELHLHVDHTNSSRLHYIDLSQCDKGQEKALAIM